MTTFLICFGIFLAVQFVWHLACEYGRQVRQKQWLAASITAHDILARELIGKIVSIEDKRDRNRVGSREYEALDLEAYDARRALANLVNDNLRENVE